VTTQPVTPSKIRPITIALIVTACISALVMVATSLRRPATEGRNEVEDTEQHVSKTVAPKIVESPRLIRPTAPAVNREGTVRTAAVPPALERILSDADLTYQARLAALHALPARISAADSEALLQYVNVGVHPEGMTESQSLAFTNDILNVLQRQPEIAGKLRHALSTLAQDPQRPLPLRDYALQHLASVQGADPAADRSAHWAAVHGPDPMLAATAMLHLLAASRQESLSEAQLAELSSSAFVLASSEECAPAARLTALQVASELGRSEVAALSLQLASSAREPFSLRIAAIAAMGQAKASPEAKTLLKVIMRGPDSRLRVPAETAFEKLNNDS
jgi:hypothetical protein